MGTMKAEEEEQQRQQTISMSCTFIDSDRKGAEEQINADTATTATSNGTDNDAVPAVSVTTTKKKKKKKKAGYKNVMADIMSGNAKNVSTTKETDHRMDGLGGGNFTKVDKI